VFADARYGKEPLELMLQMDIEKQFIDIVGDVELI